MDVGQTEGEIKTRNTNREKSGVFPQYRGTGPLFDILYLYEVI